MDDGKLSWGDRAGLLILAAVLVFIVFGLFIPDHWWTVAFHG